MPLSLYYIMKKETGVAGLYTCSNEGLSNPGSTVKAFLGHLADYRLTKGS